MRLALIRRLQRLFFLISFLLLACILYLAAQSLGYPLPFSVDLSTVRLLTAEDRVALVSGHAGSDSGAVCGNDWAPTLQEVDVVARIAALVQDQLIKAGVEVVLLEEYDPRLRNLNMKLLLSLHADSCVAVSGYKATSRVNSIIPATEERLLACIDANYAAQTGLTFHPNSITHDMTYYHAFRKILPTTPAAILEMGFLGGDGQLLTEEPERVAAGITASILCFIEGQ